MNLKRKLLFSLPILFALHAVSFGQSEDDVMVNVISNGKRIFEYDRTCWIATDSLLKINPSLSTKYFIAQKNDNVWKVGFGNIDIYNNCFKLEYEAIFYNAVNECALMEFKGTMNDTGYYYKAARAIERTVNNFKGEYRPYNYALSEIVDDRIFVYIYPGQTTYDYYRLGGDIRYEYNFKTNEIVDSTKLHNSVIKMPYSIKKDDPFPKATCQSAVLTDHPVETDIFYLLSRMFQSQHYIITNDWVYIIQPDLNFIKLTREVFEKLGK